MWNICVNFLTGGCCVLNTAVAFPIFSAPYNIFLQRLSEVSEVTLWICWHVLTNGDFDSRGAGNESGWRRLCLMLPRESLLTWEWWEEHCVCVSVDLYLHETKKYICIQREFDCHEHPLTCPLTVLTSLTLSSSEENAERIMLDPTSRENLKFKDLLKVVRHHIVPTYITSPQLKQNSQKSEENSLISRFLLYSNVCPGPDWLDQQWAGGREDHSQRPGGGLLWWTSSPEVIWWETGFFGITILTTCLSIWLLYAFNLPAVVWKTAVLLVLDSVEFIHALCQHKV